MFNLSICTSDTLWVTLLVSACWSHRDFNCLYGMREFIQARVMPVRYHLRIYSLMFVYRLAAQVMWASLWDGRLYAADWCIFHCSPCSWSLVGSMESRVSMGGQVSMIPLNNGTLCVGMSSYRFSDVMRSAVSCMGCTISCLVVSVFSTSSGAIYGFPVCGKWLNWPYKLG